MNPHNPKTKSAVREYLLISLFFALFTLATFWPAFASPTSTVPGAEGDSFYCLWSMWWISYASFNLHTSPYFTKMLFYPIGHSLTTSPFLLFESFLTFPIQLVSLPAAYNLMVLISFVLSGVFTYALVKHLVNDKYAAFVGGMLFAFSPIHIAHTFAGHLNWTNIEFIPLFILCLLLLLKEQKYRYSLFAALSLLSIVFFGDFEQGILAAVLLAVLLYFYAFLHGLRKVLTKKLLLLVLSIPLLTALFGLPYFAQVVYSLLHGAASSLYQVGNIAAEIPWSNSLLGFFIPSYYNPMYNPIVRGESPNFLGAFYTLTFKGIVVASQGQAITQDERTSYIGYLALFLFLFGIYYDLKKKRYARMLLWFSLFLFFSVMSLGPFLRISSSITIIPGPFLIYTLIPVLNIIREPGRFYFAATIPLAIIASIGVSGLYEKLGLKKGKQKILATVLISLLLFLDYSGIIAPGQTRVLFLNATVPSAYQTIEGYQQNVSVLMLPSIGNSFYQEEQIYYQTLFKKPLFNGYGKANLSQVEHIYLMPLSIYEHGLEINTSPDYQSPVDENLTLLTDVLLEKNNVGYVGVIKNAYDQSALEQLTTHLRFMFGKPVYDDNTTAIFSTASLQSRPAELAYYPSGTWLQGRLLCGYYPGVKCTTQFSNGWWGVSKRGLTISSPSDSTVNITFSISSFNQTGMKVYLYLSPNTQPIKEFSVYPNQSAERFQLQLSKGTNQLEFFMPSINSTDYYLTYDIHNFSVEK